MTVHSIPQPALAILDRVGPSFLTLLRRDDISVGGGSALAARWDHRRSTDIAITIPAPVFSEAKDRLLDLLAAAPFGQIRHGRGWLNGLCPEGEFSFVTAEPLLCPVGSQDRESRFNMVLEPVAEILGRKLLLRMYGNGEFVARDLYDICTAGERHPAALNRALSLLTADMRRELFSELSGRGPDAARMGRDLTEVHRPGWLADLGQRAAALIGPDVAPEFRAGVEDSVRHTAKPVPGSEDSPDDDMSFGM